MTHKPDCSNHPREVLGCSDMKVLAELVENLNYESQAEFVRHYKEATLKRMETDARDRPKLAIELERAASSLHYVAINMESAYDISKPFMKPKEH